MCVCGGRRVVVHSHTAVPWSKLDLLLTAFRLGALRVLAVSVAWPTASGVDAVGIGGLQHARRLGGRAVCVCSLYQHNIIFKDTDNRNFAYGYRGVVVAGRGFRAGGFFSRAAVIGRLAGPCCSTSFAAYATPEARAHARAHRALSSPCVRFELTER